VVSTFDRCNRIGPSRLSKVGGSGPQRLVPDIWARDYERLRFPLIYNLRADPFERGPQ
jgi:hypothetical protein